MKIQLSIQSEWPDLSFNYPPVKESGLFEGMADSRTGARKIQDESGTSYYARNKKKLLKKRMKR